MRVNRLALIAVLVGVALLGVFGYSLSQKWEVEVMERVPIYNLDGEQIGYVEMPKTVHTTWSEIGTMSAVVGIMLTTVGYYTILYEIEKRKRR